jgi:RNA polymerase sigma-70 factor (ECF subfamily)
MQNPAPQIEPLPASGGVWPGEKVRRIAAFRRLRASVPHYLESAMRSDCADLIRAVATRQDRKAFAALFAFYGPRIKASLLRSGVHAGAAEDLAQETLFAVWQKAALFNPQRGSASAWVYTVARNLCVDHLRRDRLERLHSFQALAEPEEPERPDEMVQYAELRQQVNGALNRLSEEQLRVVKMAFFEDCSQSVIAKRLDMPLGTAKSHLRRAMVRLRKYLGDLS